MHLFKILIRPVGVFALVIALLISVGEVTTSFGLMSLRPNTGKKSQFNTSPPPSSPSNYSSPTSSQPSGPSTEELKIQKLKKEADEANIQGIEYYNSENWDDAIVYFEEAIRKDPNNTVVRQNLRNARASKANAIGNQFIESAEYDIAIRYYREALEHGPTNEVVLENLRHAQERKDWKEGLERDIDRHIKEAEAREERLRLEEEEVRNERFRLKEEKTKEAKQNVANMLNDMAREFDVSAPVATPGSSGLVLMGLSASGKAGESSASSGLSMIRPSTRLFDKGTRDSAPVDVRSIDSDSLPVDRLEGLRDANVSTAKQSKLKQQAFEQVDRQFEEIGRQLTQAMTAEFLKLEAARNQKEAQQQFDQIMGETFKGMRERMLAHIEEQYKGEPGLKEQKLKETERYFDDLRKQSGRAMADEWLAQQEQEKQRDADRQFSKVMGSTFKDMRQQKLAQIEEQYKGDVGMKKQKLEEMERDLRNLEEQFTKKMSDEWLRQQAERRKADAMQMSKRVIDEAIKDAIRHERQQIKAKYKEAGTKVASEKVSEKSGIETNPLDVRKIDTTPRVLNIKGEDETSQPEDRKWPGAQNPEPPLLNPLWTDVEKKTKIQDWAERSEWPTKWPSDWTYEEREAAIDVFIQNGAERPE